MEVEANEVREHLHSKDLAVGEVFFVPVPGIQFYFRLPFRYAKQTAPPQKMIRSMSRIIFAV
jgi:hypothetical protein